MIATSASLFALTAHAQDAAIAIPKVDIVPRDGALAISGSVLGLAKGTVVATLTIDKSDGAGRTKTSQSREIALEEGSVDAVATTTLSYRKDLALTVTLEIMRGDSLVGSTVSSVGSTGEK